MEHVHACLIQSRLPKLLWAEAANFIIWVKNCTTTKVLGDVTPHKKLTRWKPNLAEVPEWGFDAGACMPTTSTGPQSAA